MMRFSCCYASIFTVRSNHFNFACFKRNIIPYQAVATLQCQWIACLNGCFCFLFCQFPYLTHNLAIDKKFAFCSIGVQLRGNHSEVFNSLVLALANDLKLDFGSFLVGQGVEFAFKRCIIHGSFCCLSHRSRRDPSFCDSGNIVAYFFRLVNGFQKDFKRKFLT